MARPYIGDNVDEDFAPFRSLRHYSKMGEGWEELQEQLKPNLVVKKRWLFIKAMNFRTREYHYFSVDSEEEYDRLEELTAITVIGIRDYFSLFDPDKLGKQSTIDELLGLADSELVIFFLLEEDDSQ